ncbi:endonuclease-reverse transcriptase [Plakobranchus ocellatus]|uniref:Endonuclease-reverse transcriptase n=1 Tax=Plakobranchus ocellatus TaxID=259542 RepID=A0AAV4A613_9GAST|nr:endonuclease-reverse transcriptase [Plakobranchus ocellatus]
MYWEQTAAMRIENKTSTFQDIKRGVRQGCVLSPDLFSLYSEIIMRNLENHPGIKVGGQNINNLRYADDTVLIAENKEDLQKLPNIIEEESRKKGLELNRKKTEVMVISRKQESPKCDIFINEVKLKQTEKFKYLGTIISNDGKTNREISARTTQAKINFQKMKTILTNKHISIKTRKRALQCYIEPVLMYGCEAWTISKQIQNKLEATEMWFLRRMLQIPWTAKKTNERVLNEANKRRSLVRTTCIRKRQATFLGHVMRRGKLEHLVTTGKFEGKRSRGRQREKIMDRLVTWLGPGKVSDILAAVKDRDLWRAKGHDRQRLQARHLMMMMRVAAWKRNILRVLVVLVAAGLAILLRDFFAYVGALTGAIGSSLLAYILPCIFHLKLRWHESGFFIKVKDIFIVTFGIVASILSLRTTISEIAEHF